MGIGDCKSVGHTLSSNRRIAISRRIFTETCNHIVDITIVTKTTNHQFMRGTKSAIYEVELRFNASTIRSLKYNHETNYQAIDRSGGHGLHDGLRD